MTNDLESLRFMLTDDRKLAVIPWRELQRMGKALRTALKLDFPCNGDRSLLEYNVCDALVQLDLKLNPEKFSEKVTNSEANISATPEGVMREYDTEIRETMSDDRVTESLQLVRLTSGEFKIQTSDLAPTILFESFLPGEVKRWLRLYAMMHPSKDQTPENLPDTLSTFTKEKFTRCYRAMEKAGLLKDYRLQLYTALGLMVIKDRAEGKNMVESAFVSKILEWINCDEF